MAIMLLLSLLVRREVEFEATRLDELRKELSISETQTLMIDSLRGEIEAAEQNMRSLQARKPLDIFLTLSELSAILKGRATVTHLTLEGGVLRFEGLSDDPLSLIKGFEASTVFRECTILQIVPVPETGKERFVFRATVRSQ